METGKDNGLRQLLQILWRFDMIFLAVIGVGAHKNYLVKTIHFLKTCETFFGRQCGSPNYAHIPALFPPNAYFFMHEQASILAHITQVDFLQSYPLITPITNLMLI